ncbi:intein N-terminal splicing domain protein [Leptospira broomii serovar Hurstbridge str. 5399]|uniref:Intein N-terminal splicing domain protein n=1 Tax=Leptospira broomii serovar Hurstbridge str. 5399 TaxID=1049789 RepID=T0GK80_9LEPT|nr:TIGR04388 family protein [Leptospira broomii]EQA45783.1 intein N-terminal splicing domain protein [Leptospira broomii serovar Hurstbridge str. 5399]
MDFMIRKGRYIRHDSIPERLMSCSMLSIYFWVLFFPLSTLFSQNLNNYPTFVAPQFQQQNLDQVVSLANQSNSLNNWEAISGQGLSAIKSNWENASALEIESLVSSITSSPNSGTSLQDYQNAVSAYLWAQENNAETQWLNQVDSQLSNARDNFINGQLAINISNSTTQNQQLVVTSSGNVNSAIANSADYRTALNTGLQSFSDSLTALQRTYEQQLSSLNQTDAQYKTNLLQLQSYENTVKQGMQTSVSQLQTSLQTTALFYNTKPNGTPNWNSMNQSGLDLQNLITSLSQGLANGSPLSALANQMVSYLQAQETQAQNNATYWSQKATPYNLSLTGTVLDGEQVLNGLQDLYNYGNWVSSANPVIGAIKGFIDGGSNNQDPTLINYLYGNDFNSNNYSILKINSADFKGYNTAYTNYSVYPIQTGYAGNDLYYSSAGYNAFDFNATGLGFLGGFVLQTGFFAEDKFDYSINIQLQDKNALSNSQVWSGFQNNLSTELNSWNSITSSISSWEGQISAYQAQYATWHAQAAIYTDSLQQSYSTGVANLNSQEHNWQNGLLASFQVINTNPVASSSTDSLKSSFLDSVSPKITQVLLPSDNSVLSPAAQAPVIDQSSLNNTLSIFQQSLMGASNIALENQLNRQAIDENKNAIQQIATSLGSNAVVDSHGNIVYTTSIEDGHARLKAGGDATNASDYEAATVKQNIFLSSPATIKIAAAGDLFQTWNTDSVISQNQANLDSFNVSYNSTINSLNSQVAALNSLNAKNDKAFQDAAQAAASFASDQKSLAQALFQGGNFESWVKGQIQDKVNTAMATAIANATGMSPDMAAQLVSWFEKKQADKKAKAKARTQEITSGLVTVASIAASFIAGPEMMAVGQAALQAVQGYESGGVEGALVGAVSGAAGAYARKVGVNVNVAYNSKTGFSGGLGIGSSEANIGANFSQHGSTSFSLGTKAGNINFNPNTGFSGSVNVWGTEGGQGLMVNVGQHTGPSLTYQNTDEASGVGGSVTIDGKGNTTVAATYRNATVVSATGNLHNPSSFGNLALNDNFNNDLNQNLAMKRADENLTAGRAELTAGRNAIAETGNEPQKEILNNENASAADQHGVLATLAKAGEFLTDPSSASTWLGRTTQDVVGSFLGSTGLGASDSNGFIDKNTGKYVQRTCFTAGTLIRTKDGLKGIEKIQVGDYVLSINENSGKLSYQRVKQLFVREVQSVNKLTYENGYEVTTTSNHPFYLRGRGFTEVKNIGSDERSVTVASIRNSHLIQSRSNVSIGASLASIGSESSRSNSASWSNEYNGTLGISKIEEVKEKTKVYNFEVEYNHTYFVGIDGVLVHNDCIFPNLESARGQEHVAAVRDLENKYRWIKNEITGSDTETLNSFGDYKSKLNNIDSLIAAHGSELSPSERNTLTNEVLYRRTFLANEQGGQFVDISGRAIDPNRVSDVNIANGSGDHDWLTTNKGKEVAVHPADGVPAGIEHPPFDPMDLIPLGRLASGIKGLFNFGFKSLSKEGTEKAAAQGAKEAEKAVTAAAKEGEAGGLNLFKWNDPTSTNPSGWKQGDRFLLLPNKGNPRANWEQNYSRLREEMVKGKPIYESFVDSFGNLKPTKSGSFLNAERYTLRTRGWTYDPLQKAWLPPKQ